MNKELQNELDSLFNSSNSFIRFIDIILKNNDGAIVILEGDVFVNIYSTYHLKFIHNSFHNNLVILDENDVIIKMLDISKIIYVERVVYTDTKINTIRSDLCD